MALTDDDLSRIASLIKDSEARILSHVESRLESLEDYLNHQCYQATTNLLTAFQKSAKPVELRLRYQQEAAKALDLQIEEIATPGPEA